MKCCYVSGSAGSVTYIFSASFCKYVLAPEQQLGLHILTLPDLPQRNIIPNTLPTPAITRFSSTVD